MKHAKTLMAVLCFLLSGSLSLPLAAAPPAQAEPAVAEDGLVVGVLDVVNRANGTVTMDDVTYEVSTEVADLSTFAAGDAVVLGYVVNGGGGLRAISLSKQELG